MSKLFNIKKSDTHNKLTLMGIKLNIKNKKRIQKRRLDVIEFNAFAATRGNTFLWLNKDNLTYSQEAWFVSQQFYERLGYYPNLLNPKSFNENLQWYKLNYRNDLMTTYVDKFTFKQQIEKELGKGYTVPLLGVWDDVNKIDFDRLPKSFVLKVNHGGGGQYGIRIVKDKNSIDLDELKYTFNNWMQPWQSVYYYRLDWAYKNIKPLILAEEYIEDCDGKLPDYKFLCFNGEPKILWVDQNRFNGHTRNFYDMDKNLLDCEFNYPRTVTAKSEIPASFEQMKEIARTLSKPFPHVRVDFYELDNKPVLSELTFYSESGLGKFTDRKWDYKLGEYFDFSNIDKKYLRTDMAETHVAVESNLSI